MQWSIEMVAAALAEESTVPPALQQYDGMEIPHYLLSATVQLRWFCYCLAAFLHYTGSGNVDRGLEFAERAKKGLARMEFGVNWSLYFYSEAHEDYRMLEKKPYTQEQTVPLW